MPKEFKSDEEQLESLALWMTREEFQIAYAYAWTAIYYPTYGLDDDAQTRELLKEHFGLAMLWSVTQLALRHGMIFRALAVDHKGRVTMQTEDPIEPNNEWYLLRFRRNKGVHFVNLYTLALRGIEERALKNFDAEPMREFLHLAIKDYEAAKAVFEPEEKEMLDDAMRELLRIAGVRVLGDRKMEVN